MISRSTCYPEGGHWDKGLREELSARGYEVFDRELNGAFRKLPFGEQIAIIASDLKSAFWHKDAQVVAISFGAYLFLHAQTLLEPFIGRILLLSPIVGEATNEEHLMFFVPPRARHLQELARSGV